MLRDRLGRFANENKSKFQWIGKRLFIGLLVALFASIAIEATIYSLADKMVEAYTAGYEVSFK